MICIIALIVFGILGIFSISYRKLAKEAFDCVFRKFTFRKCRTNLDQRLKGQITGKIMRHNVKAGAFVYKKFEILSFIFTILMMASFIYSAYSVYNLIIYDNCNGEQGGVCVLTQNQEEVPCEICDKENCTCVDNCEEKNCTNCR
jgi:hypothetical protein